MDYTDHIMLVGAGAKKFALEMGFKEQNLLTEQSRAGLAALEGEAEPERQLARSGRRRRRAASRAAGVGAAGATMRRSHVYYDEHGVPHTYGTINMNAVNANGDIGSVTTTSGLSWKIPGRVGDSPIIGAGQYCDNEVGAAGSTGRGEANIKVCGAFLAVEFMRQGMSPEAALMKVMERVIAMTEKRLLDDKGRPYFQLEYYAVNKKGEYAGACCYEGSRFRRGRREGRAPREVRLHVQEVRAAEGSDQRRDDQAVRPSTLLRQRAREPGTTRTIRVVAWIALLAFAAFSSVCAAIRRESGRRSPIST